MTADELSVDTTDEIDRIAQAYIDDGTAPGLAYGVVRNGDVIHSGGAGVVGVVEGDGAPDSSSVFRIASMTKSFTAAAALLLRDEGALSLDEPVATYVPALAELPGVTADAPLLTLRLLLTMAGGFPSDDPWADRQESLSEEGFVSLLRGGPRFASVPGTGYEYSNLGYAIVGRAVGNVAGQPFRQFVSERLLRPLGMTSTCFASDGVPVEHLVRGHRRVGESWQREPFDQPGEFSPIGGLYSSVDDLAVWVRGFTNAAAGPIVADDHPLSPASRREMQQGHRMSGAATSAVDGVAHAVASAYGMGLTRDHHTHWGDVVGHSGGYPGFGSNMRWHPVSGFGVITLANATYARPGFIGATMLEALLRGGAPRFARPTPWPELMQMRAAVERLIAEWDDGLADEIFAANMDLDEPRAERRAQVITASGRLGNIDPTAPADEDQLSATELDWTVTGSSGAARIEIGLSPEPSPRIQHLSVTFVEPASTGPNDELDDEPAVDIAPI